MKAFFIVIGCILLAFAINQQLDRWSDRETEKQYNNGDYD